MATPRRGLSPDLLAAQQRLEILQQQKRRERLGLGQVVTTDEHGRPLLPLVSLSPAASSSDSIVDPLDHIPVHLGWESAPLAAALRTSRKKQKEDQAQDEKSFTLFTPDTLRERPPSVPARQTVKLYPDVALGMLRQEQATTGRIWLLLRHLNSTGCGWVSIEQARKDLTHKKSPVYICGWRQLRNLLAQGENIFWQRQKDRIWLYSVARTAAALGIWRLNQRPIALPISVLKERIGTVRAHFYASFHSGRMRESTSGKQQSQPIARDSIAEMTEVNPRTQRIYEKRAAVQKKQNFALGEQATAEKEQGRAWQQGQALFHLTDYKGKQGKPGTTYLAWQLPNTYVGPHRQRPKGRQQRINQKLADLFTQGITGNRQETVNESKARPSRRFYDNGRLAAKAYNRSTTQDIYWRSCQRASKHGRYQLWHLLPGGR